MQVIKVNRLNSKQFTEEKRKKKQRKKIYAQAQFSGEREKQEELLISNKLK